jgi:UDP-glucose:(heptosyl)LPS alpha-1,3-glucosyltransferase
VRVALVIERFEPRGGVEHVAWEAAHALAAAGDEVSVVARRAAPTPALRWIRADVPALWQPWRVLAFSRAAARLAPRERFDVVHSFSRTLHQDVYRAGGGSHADYLAARHGATGARLRSLFSPRHRVLLEIERRVFADTSQHVLCNSKMVRDALVRRYSIDPARLAVIYNGVDLALFHPDRHDGAALRRELGDRDAPVWLFVGSGFARKGLDTALRALADVPGVLWVVGRDDPDPWRANAARCGVADRVRWLGERDDVESLLAAADALLLPTRYDAFANVCLEAMAAGRPVVTSARNGAAEILGAGGCVVDDAEHAPAFGAALRSLTDPGVRREMGRVARAQAERFSWTAHAAELRSLYARIRR